MNDQTRRQFIQTSIAASAACSLSCRVFGAESANEQVSVGVIGCGWRGGQLLETFSSVPGVNIAGLCDADRARLDESAAKYPRAKTWTDLRGMLDESDIDAVVIATCNHWHCLAAIWAMEAGKHVYVEKPLAHFHWEGRQVVNASRKHRRICQVGTQQRSDPMQAEIKSFLHQEQALGPIRWVRANRFGVRQSIGKRFKPLPIPQTVNYDMWLGPARDEPILRNELHYDWHWDWNTGSGEMGNWGVHIIDDVRNNVFQDQINVPRRVVAAGGRFVWNDAGNTPNFQFAILDTGTFPLVIALCNLSDQPGGDDPPARPGPGSGYVVYCEGGRLEGQRGSAAAFDADGKRVKQFKGNSGSHHAQNFIDALRSGDSSLLNAPAEIGHYSTAWCNLANVAFRTRDSAPAGAQTIVSEFGADSPAKAVYEELNDILAGRPTGPVEDAFRLGPVFELDPQREQFVGNHATDANRFLRREDRSGFVVPEIKT